MPYTPTPLSARFRGQLRHTLRTDLPEGIQDLLVPFADRETMALCHRTRYGNVTMHVVSTPTLVYLEVWTTSFAGKYPALEKIEGRDKTVWGRVYYRADLKVWISHVVDLPGDTSFGGSDERHRTFQGALCRCRLLVDRYAPEPKANWQKLFIKHIRPLKRLFPSWQEVVDEKGALVYLHEMLHRPILDRSWLEALEEDARRCQDFYLEYDWIRQLDEEFNPPFAGIAPPESSDGDAAQESLNADPTTDGNWRQRCSADLEGQLADKLAAANQSFYEAHDDYWDEPEPAI